MLCDPSHMGAHDLILKLSQQAMGSYFGLMIEVHCCPDDAWSDKEQQITPDALKQVLDGLVIRDTVQTTESLAALRDQIDDLDNELLRLLSKRMRVSREIGHTSWNMVCLSCRRNGTTIYSPIGQAMESAWICRATSSSRC